jgi:carboxymethylenebutenolidase
MTDIDIAAPDGGTFTGYLATPAVTPAPGIVLIQEIFGVNVVMRTIADSFAAEGFTVLCPDLFWRQEPGIQITDQSDEEWARAFELYEGFDAPAGIGDLGATLDHLRGLDSCNGKVGCVGYCLGGTLAYLMAANTGVDAAVGYYGVGIEGLLDQSANISKPLMLHIAENDDFSPKEAQDAIKQHFAGAELVTIHSYPGMAHAFARVGGQPYNAGAAELANGRTLEHLNAALA